MLNKIRKLREKKGFTLVELIVVIAIIAILTAVLVPLIGNWTQQAAYTTLQDGAQTISNTVNEAISKVMMGGAPSNTTVITGTKATGATTLTVTTTPAAVSGDTNDKIATEVKNMLESTLPANSCFYAVIDKGAVKGIIYSNATSDLGAASGGAWSSSTAITQLKSFDNAYQAGTLAVGVSGDFKSKATLET